MVKYRGKIPDRNYTLRDFLDNNVVLHWYVRFENGDGIKQIRCIFRSNGLMGEIRTTCYGDTYAIDVSDGWGEKRCITTECKSLREAKSILFIWFKTKGFQKSMKDMNNWRSRHLIFINPQLKLPMLIFNE